MKPPHISKPTGAPASAGKEPISQQAGAESLSGAAGQIVPDTIRSHSTLRLLALLSAGPIEGLVDGARSIFLDDVPLLNKEGTSFFDGVKWSLAKGQEATHVHQNLGFNATEQIHVVNRLFRAGRYQNFANITGHAVRLSVSFPQGLYARFGTLVTATDVTLSLMYLHGRSWRHLWTKRIYEKQTSAFEMSFHTLLPQSTSRHQLRVRLEISDKDKDTRYQRAVRFDTVTWVLADRLSYKGLATLGLEIPAQATEGRVPSLQLDIKGRLIKIPSSYDPVSRRYQPVWDGQFVTAYSNNPAWVIYDLLTDSAFGLGLKKDHIAIFDLLAIARHCDELLDHPDGGQRPRHVFNAILDKRQPAARLIQDICATIRAIFFWSGGRLHFAQDKPSSPVRLVNNQGIEDGRFRYAGPSMRHAYSHVFVSYLDEAYSGKKIVETAFDEDHYHHFGYRPLEVFALGCTDRAAAARHARWLLKTNNESMHAISYVAALDHFTDDPVRPGDVIAIQDKYSQISTAPSSHQRRLLPLTILPKNQAHKALISTSGEAGRFLIDGDVAPGYWRAFFQLPDGEMQQCLAFVFSQKTDVAYQQISFYDSKATQTLVMPQPDIHSLISLHQIGEEVSIPHYRVTAVRELAGQRVEVTALRYHHHRFKAIDAPLHAAPEVISEIKTADEALTAVSGLSLTQEDSWQNSVMRHQLVIRWQDNRTPKANHWHLSLIGPDGIIKQYQATQPKWMAEDVAPGRWDVTIKLQSDDGFMGPASQAHIVIRDEVESLPVPAAPVIKARPQALVFTFPEPQITGQIGQYEIWQGKAESAKHIATTPASEVMIDVASTGLESYRWRYIRPSLKASEFSPAVTIAALPALKDGVDGKDGRDGIQGEAGKDGVDGKDGLDGKEGAAGTQILTAKVNLSRWSDTQAQKQIVNATARLPRQGDIVTLQGTTSSYSETRRFNGTAWEADITLLSGSVLLKESVPASAIKQVGAAQIKGGIFQSTNYKKNLSGFAINTKGNAEFNEAILRGTLTSGRVEASHIVAPIITLPTQAGGRFQTHFLNRHIKPAVTSHDHHKLVFGPMIVVPDVYDHLFGDGHVKILSSQDRYGDDADAKQNDFFTRFRATAPLIKLALRFTQSPDQWGKVIQSLSAVVKLRAGSNVILQSSPALENTNALIAKSYVSFAQNTVRQASGFEDVIEAHISRHHIASPHHTNLSSGCTESYVITATMRPQIVPVTPLVNKPLYLECHISAKASGLTKTQILDSLKEHSEVQMESLL